MQQLLVSPSPHIHADITTRRLMMDVIIALLPATIIACVMFGWNELAVIAASVISCVFFEWLITRFLLKKESTVGDLSAAVTGLLLALNLPAATPVWVVVIGALVAIGVAKMSFGGLGQNVFNPALVARVFLLISFPVYMTTWVNADISSAWNFGVDAVTGPTLLGLLNEGVPASSIDAGTLAAGSAGEFYPLALIAGFIYLLVRKVIRPWITLSILLTAFIFAAVMYFCDPVQNPQPFAAILCGGLLLGSIFMATDYVTSPMTTAGGIVFGIGIGVLTMVIRYWGSYPEGVSFAILIMNAFVPLINKAFRTRKFGRA